MEVEVVGLPARGLEQGQSFSPGIARSFAASEIVQGTETDEVPARDDGFAWPQTPVARELREPGAFGDHIDACHLEPRPVLKDGPCVGKRGGDRVHRLAKDRETVVVLAQIDESALQIIRSLIHLLDFAGCRVFRGDQVTFLRGECFEGRTFVEEREALGLDVFVVAVEQAVVHARLRELGVLLHIEKSGELSFVRMPDFHHAGLVAEMQAGGRYIGGERRPAHRNFFPHAIDEVTQKGQHLGIDDILFHIGAEAGRPVTAQARLQLFAHVFEDRELFGLLFSSL